MERQKFVVFLVLLMISLVDAFPTFYEQTRKPCKKQKFEYGYVCVCTADYCDSLYVPMPKANEYVFVTSSADGERFIYEKGKVTKSNNDTNAYLEIDSSKVYQKIRGFGGAYSGSVTHLINKLSPSMRKCFYTSYFSSRSGMGYKYIRIPIGGTDCDVKPWAYNEYPENDANLSNFTKLDTRDLMRNKQLKELALISKNDNVKYLAAAWSPPRWMKQNNEWFGLENSQLLPEYYGTWANYHIKWMELMQNDKINIWAISTGNEPQYAKRLSTFQIMYWNGSNHANWIAEYLGPAVQHSKFANVKIFGVDDNRNLYQAYADEMEKANKKSFDYMSAIQFHAYFDSKTQNPEELDEVQSKFPNKEIWYSEMSFGIGLIDKFGGPRLGLWDRAEKLIKILIDVFNHSTVGYLDWNLILSHEGGPMNSFTGNASLDAPIILNEEMTEMYKQPMFYVFAHFSKFITPGSIRIDAKLYGVSSSDVQATAFQRPDDKIAIILYNNSTENAIDLTVRDTSYRAIKLNLRPKSINTLVYSTRENNKNTINIFFIPSLW